MCLLTFYIRKSLWKTLVYLCMNQSNIHFELWTLRLVLYILQKHIWYVSGHFTLYQESIRNTVQWFG